MLVKPIENPIQPLIWVRVIQNLIIVLRKVNVFEARKLIHLQNMVAINPDGTLKELMSLLKDAKKRVVNRKKEVL